MTYKLFKKIAMCISFVIGISALNAGVLACTPNDGRNYETKSVRINDVKISYEVSKNNPDKVVILQHGAFMNNLSMEGLADRFNGYKVIIPDLPGHGASTAQREITSVDEMSDITIGFIEKLKDLGEIKRNADVTYIGWSMGGSIGLELAYKTRLIDHLVLVSSAPVWTTIPSIPEDAFLPAFKGLFQSELSPGLSEEQIKRIMGNLDAMCVSARTCMNDITALQKLNITEPIKKIKIPVLIISGENDHIALPECQTVMSRNIINSKLKMVKNEGHDMVIDNPEIIYAEVKAFLQERK